MCHLLLWNLPAVWHWITYIFSEFFNFLISKVKMTKVLSHSTSMTQNKKKYFTKSCTQLIIFLISMNDESLAQLKTVLLTKLWDDFYLNFSEFLRRNHIVYKENYFSLTFFYGYPLFCCWNLFLRIWFTEVSSYSTSFWNSCFL